jgi:hypothetical protein
MLAENHDRPHNSASSLATALGHSPSFHESPSVADARDPLIAPSLGAWKPDSTSLYEGLEMYTTSYGSEFTVTNITNSRFATAAPGR